MTSEVWSLKEKLGNVNNIYCNSANPEIIQTLKKEFDEPYDNEHIKERIAYAKKYQLYVEDQMFIVPTPFSIEGKRMLQHAKYLLEEKDEDGSSLLAIDRERFHQLVTALRTAVANEYKLDKEATVYDDLLDSFLLALQYYKRKK